MLLGNGSELSFDQISSGLYKTLPDRAWLCEVFARYAVWQDADGKLWKQDYSVGSDGSVAWSGTAEEVRREVKYESVTNLERDPMKDKILAAHRAGIFTCIIPSENQKDLKDIPPRVMREMKIIAVEHMDQVLRSALVLAHPESFLSQPSQPVDWRTSNVGGNGPAALGPGLGGDPLSAS